MSEAPPVEPSSRLVSNIRITDHSPTSDTKPTEDVPHVDTGKLGDRETRHRTGRETKVADALSDMPPEEGVKALATMASTEPPADRKSGVKPPKNRRDSSAGPPETKSESAGSPPRKPPDEPPTPGAPDEEPDESADARPPSRLGGTMLNRTAKGGTVDSRPAAPAEVHIDKTPLTPAEQERLTVIRNEHFGRSYEVGGKLHVIDNIDDKGTIYSSTFEDGKRKEHIHPRGEKADEYSELLEEKGTKTPEITYDGPESDPAIIFAQILRNNPDADGVGGMIRLRGKDGRPDQLLMIRSVNRDVPHELDEPDDPILEIVRTRRNGDGELVDDLNMKMAETASASQVHYSTVSELKGYLKRWNEPAESATKSTLDKLRKLFHIKERSSKREGPTTTTRAADGDTTTADISPATTGAEELDPREAAALAKEREGKESDTYHFATQLVVMGDEDGPPISKQIQIRNADGTTTTVTILSTADGLGGGGAKRYVMPDSPKPTTGAYIGSRAVQSAVGDTFSALSSAPSPDLSHDSLKAVLETAITERIGSLNYYTASKVTGRMGGREYATTVSTNFVIDDGKQTRVDFMWAGDSPMLLLLAPENEGDPPVLISPNISSESGEKPMGEDIIYKAGKNKLRSASVTFDSGRAYRLVNSTDALCKFAVGEEIGAVDFLRTSDEKSGLSNDPDKQIKGMQDRYQEIRSAWRPDNRVNEEDDFTLAGAGRGRVKYPATPFGKKPNITKIENGHRG